MTRCVQGVMGISLALTAALSLAEEASQNIVESRSAIIDSRNIHIDLHRNNRAIAFATFQLLEQGKDIQEWKAIYAYPTDVEWTPTPDLSNDSDADIRLPGPHPVQPNMEVIVVTEYEFQECSDGRAVILRKGYGQFVRSALDGLHFYWQEIDNCDQGGPLALTDQLQDPHRPIERNDLRITHE